MCVTEPDGQHTVIGETPEKKIKGITTEAISYYFGRVEGKTNQNSK